MSGCCDGPVGGDDAVLADWWRQVQAKGSLPDDAVPVRTRLVRAVGTAALPSGKVYLKVMSFPRWTDRLRYLLRSLPAEHEASMLRSIAAAGIPCPEVVAVRTSRRRGMPHRSLLVLRALPVASASGSATDGDDRGPVERLRQRAALARRLLEAGLHHPDLNPDNFVRLTDGRLAILDLQSMSRCFFRERAGRAMAARLLLEAALVDEAAATAILAASGLVDDDGAALVPMAVRIAHAYLRKRVHRCWRTSTEFVCSSWGMFGVEHRRRGALAAGRWHPGGVELERCWLGQRLLEEVEGRPPVLLAIRRKWSWLPGARAVYVPATVDEERVRDELRALMDGHARLAVLLRRRPAPPLRSLQAWRTRGANETSR